VRGTKGGFETAADSRWILFGFGGFLFSDAARWSIFYLNCATLSSLRCLEKHIYVLELDDEGR
jgi:hypothetical protein